jgi:hypothetical protein
MVDGRVESGMASQVIGGGGAYYTSSYGNVSMGLHVRLDTFVWGGMQCRPARESTLYAVRQVTHLDARSRGFQKGRRRADG